MKTKTISEVTPTECSYLDGSMNCLECKFCKEIDIENESIECDYENE